MAVPQVFVLVGGGSCGSGDCPSVFTTDTGTIAVQGYTLNKATPDGESIVEIPQDVLKEAVRALGW
jgi:hypothetical protein